VSQQGLARADRLEARQAELLPVPYFARCRYRLLHRVSQNPTIVILSTDMVAEQG
jgi:hypothetical protein